MLRSALLLILLVSVVAVAAPVPPASEKDRIAALWGKTEGDGEFSLTGGQLTLRTKGKPVHNSKLPAQRTMPHTVRAVSGDFEVAVRVLDAPGPDPKAKIDHAPGSHISSAGLFVAGGDYRLVVNLWQCYHTRKDVVDKVPARRIWVDAWFTEGAS